MLSCPWVNCPEAVDTGAYWAFLAPGAFSTAMPQGQLSLGQERGDQNDICGNIALVYCIGRESNPVLLHGWPARILPLSTDAHMLSAVQGVYMNCILHDCDKTRFLGQDDVMTPLRRFVINFFHIKMCAYTRSILTV